jgi:transcriptional regulator NrdR family protein
VTVRGVKCPYRISEELKTLETNDSPEDTMRRRKECIKCGKCFTTNEYVETVELMLKGKKEVTTHLKSLDRIAYIRVRVGLQTV